MLNSSNDLPLEKHRFSGGRFLKILAYHLFWSCGSLEEDFLKSLAYYLFCSCVSLGEDFGIRPFLVVWLSGGIYLRVLHSIILITWFSGR